MDVILTQGSHFPSETNCQVPLSPTYMLEAANSKEILIRLQKCIDTQMEMGDPRP